MRILENQDSRRSLHNSEKCDNIMTMNRTLIKIEMMITSSSNLFSAFASLPEGGSSAFTIMMTICTGEGCC